MEELEKGLQGEYVLGDGDIFLYNEYILYEKNKTNTSSSKVDAASQYYDWNGVRCLFLGCIFV